MPYNNTPIEPPKTTEYSGSASLPRKSSKPSDPSSTAGDTLPPTTNKRFTELPVARIKKIIHADDDIGACSNNAAFAITVATEMFIRHMSEQTYNVVRSERRPRRTLAYRDVATAVHKYDNLEFLVDVVPKTITYKQWKDKQDMLSRKERAAAGQPAENEKVNGQRTIEQMTKGGSRDRLAAVDGAAEDEGMADGEAEDGNGESAEAADGETQSGSSQSLHTAQASPRQPYDPVRNGVDRSSNADTSMEED